MINFMLFRFYYEKFHKSEIWIVTVEFHEKVKFHESSCLLVSCSCEGKRKSASLYSLKKNEKENILSCIM